MCALCPKIGPSSVAKPVAMRFPRLQRCGAAWRRSVAVAALRSLRCGCGVAAQRCGGVGLGPAGRAGCCALRASRRGALQVPVDTPINVGNFWETAGDSALHFAARFGHAEVRVHLPAAARRGAQALIGNVDSDWPPARRSPKL